MENIQNITLDIMNNHIFNYAYSKQYDQGRIIKFKVVDGGKPVDLTNVTAIFQAKKPDGTVIYNSCQKDVDNNLLLVDIDEQMTVCAGKIDYQIQLVEGEDILTTVTGHIKINESVVHPDDVISSSEFNALSDALIQVNKGYAFYLEEVKTYMEEIKNYATVKVSVEEPTEQSIALWINPDSDEEINVPEILDNEISSDDTWSSSKIYEEINYAFEALDTEINKLKKSVSDGKSLIASAITDKGIETESDATYEVMAENINDIQTDIYGLIGTWKVVGVVDDAIIGVPTPHEE